MNLQIDVATARPKPAAAITYALHGNCYVNLTSRCTLRCAFCPKFRQNNWTVQGYPLRLQREPSAIEVVTAVGDPRGYSEVVFCGLGEPTLCLPVLLEATTALQRRGARVRVNTDGLANWVYGRDVTPELAGRVDALSISLNAQDEATYVRHCRPKLPGAYPALLDFVRRARDHVPAITLTAVDGLPGVNAAACGELAAGLGVGFRRRVLDEVG